MQGMTGFRLLINNQCLTHNETSQWICRAYEGKVAVNRLKQRLVLKFHDLNRLFLSLDKLQDTQ